MKKIDFFTDITVTRTDDKFSVSCVYEEPVYSSDYLRYFSDMKDKEAIEILENYGTTKSNR